jgi:hypothetical protein
LKRLKLLNLSNNSFVGEIPSRIDRWLIKTSTIGYWL